MRKHKIFISGVQKELSQEMESHNPLLTECMYQAGYIERFGTGTLDIIRLSKEAGVSEPKFDLDEGFKVVIWRTSTPQVPLKHLPSTRQAPDKHPTSTGEVMS